MKAIYTVLYTVLKDVKCRPVTLPYLRSLHPNLSAPLPLLTCLSLSVSLYYALYIRNMAAQGCSSPYSSRGCARDDHVAVHSTVKHKTLNDTIPMGR